MRFQETKSKVPKVPKVAQNSPIATLLRRKRRTSVKKVFPPGLDTTTPQILLTVYCLQYYATTYCTLAVEAHLLL